MQSQDNLEQREIGKDFLVGRVESVLSSLLIRFR